MDQGRVSELWSRHDLPGDLWAEILSRSPVKSLLRFRSVSKLWKSIIDDPNTCRLHLGRFKNNCLETRLLAVQGRNLSHECVVIKSSRTFRTTKKLCSLDNTVASTNANAAPLGHVKKWDVIGSIDGLVMLKNSRTVSAPELVLWNPSIRKTRSIPFPSEILNGLQYVDMGLGFDPLINDYKHVRLVKQGMDNLHSIEVYTVGTGLWKTIQFQCEGCSSWQWFPGSLLNQQEAVFFKGRLYTILMNRNSGAWELISFDLSREVFAFASLPGNCRPPTPPITHQYRVFGGGRSLAVCRALRAGFCVGSIWVLESCGIDTEPVRWSRPYATSPMWGCPMDGFLFVKKNGDVLYGGRGWVSCHNLETGEEECLVAGRRTMEVAKVSPYIESLILLN